MSSGTSAPRATDGTEPEHAWHFMLIGWTMAFWVFIGLAAIVQTFSSDLSPSRRAAGYLVVGTLAVAHLALRPSPDVDFYGRDLAYLTVVVIGVGVGCAVNGNLSLLLFIAYPQMWMFSETALQGGLLSGALTVSGLLGLMAENGWSWDSLAFLGPTMLISVVFSLLMGIWVTRIVEQSRERAELIDQLEATRSELGEVHHAQGVAAERERLAREIHDTLAQGFTSVIMLAQAARAEMEARAETPSPTTARLDAIELVARENLGEARALVAAFGPVALEGATLTDAISRLAGRFGTETGVAIDVEVDDPAGDLAGLPRDREVVLLRSAQEALANVRRHARARLVTVRLSIPRSAGPARAVVEVQDDGIGFEPTEGAGFGLTGMRDRVREAGGELEVDSAPGRGTRVRACVPVELTAPAEDAAGVPVTP